MNKLVKTNRKDLRQSDIDENKKNASGQNTERYFFPSSIGQFLDAYLAQFTDAVQALRNDVLQLKPSIPTVVDSAEKLLTASQTAEMLGVCRQTVFDYARRGLLIAHRLGGRTYFKQGEVVAALHSPQPPTGRRKQARRMR